ncbi:MAG: bifunctional tetrahydrofolate synthase/dihydrofolate synthase [Gammaproteobacteria bacterium]
MVDGPPFPTLADWLAWQERSHPRVIDLGLERVATVLERLGVKPPPFQVITVAGTNGKGSTVAFLHAILRAGGFRVGAYTSPHLLRYNERVRIDGEMASDVQFCRAFAEIDAARGELSLSYFEFGTLAAFLIFRDAGVEVAVLEVGMGGRLDAVNTLDADAAAVIMIDIDHTEWLGQDRDSIGYEKACIYRAGRPAILADPDPPASVLRHAEAIGARLYRYRSDFDFTQSGATWNWWWRGGESLTSLPLPRLAGEHQLLNAAAAIMTLRTLAERLPLAREAIVMGLRNAQARARFERIPGAVEWILDVGHNPQAARTLAQCLNERPGHGQTLGVVGMLRDKDCARVAEALRERIDGWYSATLDGARGQTGEALAAVLREAGAHAVRAFATVADACRAAREDAAPGDRIVVFGSFHTVAAALKAGIIEETVRGYPT